MKISEKTVVGFVGLPAAGKSTALEAVEDLGKIITMGDVVREETKNRGYEINPTTLGMVSKKLRQDYGIYVISIRCVEKIQTLDDPIIFIDGLRSMNEVVYFRKYWKFPIIAILCDDEIRHNRLIERRRSDDTLDKEEILERDRREIGFGLDKVIENADYKIENNESKELLKSKVRKIVEELISLKI